MNLYAFSNITKIKKICLFNYFFQYIIPISYCASKAAMSTFTHAVRSEMKYMKLNIDFTLVCPYALTTAVHWGKRLENIFPFLNEEY